MPKKILFLTTHNLATNPRLVKEIRLALLHGFAVEVICFEFDNWSKDMNELLKAQLHGVKLISIPAGRKPFIRWTQSVISECGYRILGNVFSLDARVLSQSVSRRSNLITRALYEASTPDWVVGHNPGALYATHYAAQKFNCRSGFDVEDYHPGEGNDLHLQSLTKKLMTSVLPQMDYVSFASPLIMEKVKMDSKIERPNWFTVLNYFPAEEFVVPNNLNDGPVKMVWFSQNINGGRGLELILPFVIREINNVELHLIGNLNPDFYAVALREIPNVFIHSAMLQKPLHQQLSEFDIGLALEPAKDENNELAISNKMLAYLQAGLFVLASNTKAQEGYLQEMPDNGICFDYKLNDSDIFLSKILGQIKTIRAQRKIRYESFKNRNWENESSRLLKEWER